MLNEFNQKRVPNPTKLWKTMQIEINFKRFCNQNAKNTKTENQKHTQTLGFQGNFQIENPHQISSLAQITFDLQPKPANA